MEQPQQDKPQIKYETLWKFIIRPIRDEYEDDDENYQSVFKAIQNVGNISIFSRLIHSAGLNDQIEQSNDDDYSDNISDVRKNNYCVEFIYNTKQDRIIYVDGNSKVITFDKLLYVLPTAKGVNNVIVYYAEGSNGYEKFNPLIMNGNTENIINLIDCL